MKKQVFKDGKLNNLISGGGRKGAVKDFAELLKRTVRYSKLIKK